MIVINPLQTDLLLNIKGQYMNTSNILVINAATKFLRNDTMLNTKSMKESNSLVGNVAYNFLTRKITVNTNGQARVE